MAPMRRNTRKGGNNRAEQLSYSGPVRLPTADGLDAKITRVNLSTTYTLASDSAGGISAVAATSDVTTTGDWSSYVNLYQEYRVVGIELRYVPNYNGTYTSTVVVTTGVTASFHVPFLGTSPNIDTVVQNATWKPWRSSTSSITHWKMRGSEEAQFTQVGATPANHGYIELFAPGATVSTLYGRVIVTFLVDYRGRR
jgi:hypothetical protein